MIDGLLKFVGWWKAAWANPAFSMRQLLAMLVLAIAVPLLLLTAVMYQGMASAERRAVRDGLMNQARGLAALVDNEVDKHIVLAGTLAASQALRDGDLARFERQARQALIVLPGAWLSLSTPDGRFLMSTLVEPGAPLPARGSLDLLKKAWATGQPQISDVVAGPISKRRNAFIEYPVFRNDVPLYSIVVGLNPDRFLALLRGKGNEGSVIGIVDRHHNFVARVPDHQARVGTPAADGWRTEMKRVNEGFSDAPVLEGERSLTAFSPTTSGWTVGIATSFKHLEAPINRILWPFGLFATFVTLASLGLGIGMARQISRSTRALKKSALSLGTGAFTDPLSSPIREVAEIGDALRATSEELSARQAGLNLNEDRLRRARDTFLNLVQHAPYGLYLVDAKLRILQVSAGAQRAFASVSPVLGHDLGDAMRTLWPQPVATEVIARFRHTLETGESFHQSQLQEKRRDLNEDEAYDWQIERVTLPDGEYGVVCYFYDLTQQMRAEAALRESEVRLRGTFENAAVGVAHVGLDGRWLEVNERLCELVGYERDELLERTIQDLTHPEEIAADREFARQLLAGDIASYNIDKRMIRKDASAVWIGLTVALRRNADGTPQYFISIFRDITLVKDAQDQQAFLQHELAHRLKNQLAVIQAMTGQTARSAKSVQELRENLNQRIQGLAVGTDLLIQQDWSGANLRDLVERQLRTFCPSTDQMSCDGPNITLGPDAVQAIGLALHELATNAVKHGAWSTAAGTVKVSWFVVHDGPAERRLHVAWRESGGPAVAEPTRKGFGRVVIETMVAQKLSGNVEIAFPPDGFSWTLSLPSAHFSQEPARSRRYEASAQVRR